MEIQTVAIELLTPDSNNARRHPEENLQAIQESLLRFGQVLPLVVRCGVVIGGNGTLAVMKRLGWGKAKIVNFEGTTQEARALAIALNRTSELAQWDSEALAQSLVDSADAGFTPEALGFTEAALEVIFPAEAAEFRIAQPAIDKPPAKEPEVPLIQYALIFDDEPQQKRFFAFLSRIKKAYPDEVSVAARLDRFIIPDA